MRQSAIRRVCGIATVLAVGTECQCERCALNPSTTFQQAHRLACEARLLLTWPLARRREYLEAKPVQARRPELEAEIMRQHAAKAS